MSEKERIGVELMSGEQESGAGGGVAQSRCVLITGPGHAATRLFVQMLGRHPDIAIPHELLNSASEFTPLHKFFVRANESMPLESDRYDLDLAELRAIVDEYRAQCDPAKSYYVLKMPHYPLVCLEELDAILDIQAVLFIERPTKKIMASYISRGQDERLFAAPEESLRQINKCLAGDRQRLLATRDIRKILPRQIEAEYTHARRWEARHPDRPVVYVSAEKVAVRKGCLRDVMRRVGITSSEEVLADIRGIIDVDRLLRRDQFHPVKRAIRLARRIGRLLVPPRFRRGFWR